MPDLNEFRQVRRRRKRGHPVKVHQRPEFLRPDESDADIDCGALLRKLYDATIEITESSFKKIAFANLTRALGILNADHISEILCYGLGPFSQNKSSKYQLAFILALKLRYNCQVYVYDPVFRAEEVEILQALGLEVIQTNEEGKRVVNEQITLVYMPHCSKQLTNNFLYANWGRALSNCILLTNSFSDVIEHSVDKNLSNSAAYIVRIHPYVTEIRMKNDFKYCEVFSGFNIQIFTKRELSKVPPDFWTMREEPHYEEEDLEFILVENAERLHLRQCNCFPFIFRIIRRAGNCKHDISKMNSNLGLIRSLVREVCLHSRTKGTKDNGMVRYILDQARAHKETSEVLCKEREELKKLAETYLCYLQSSRRCHEIQQQYAGKGERSIKETADLVGFKLPHDPK